MEISKVELALDVLRERITKEKRVHSLDSELKRIVKGMNPVELDEYIMASEEILQKNTLPSVGEVEESM